MMARTYAAAAALLLTLLFGVWLGSAWQRGRTAIAQQKADQQTIKQLSNTAKQLQEHAVDMALAYQQAAERMGAIAQQLETDREANRQFEQAQRKELAQLLAARPDLRDVRIGADLLRHWQASNAGTDAGSAAASAASQRDDPVPSPAATR